MNKKIIGMGTKHLLPFQDEYIDFYSSSDDASLIDGDLIVFSPKFFDYPCYNQKEFDGEQLLTKEQSQLFQDEFQYWQIEIDNAIKEKKTIFIFCEQPKRFYFYSESLVYPDFFVGSLLLFDLSCLKRYHLVSGQEIKYRNKNILLRPLWEDLKKYFCYKIAFQKKDFSEDVYFVPKNFDPKKEDSDVFGGIIKTPSGGFVVVLPAINLEHPDLKLGIRTQNVYNNEKVFKFSNQLIQHIIQIDLALKSYHNPTPPPLWFNNNKFKISAISKIEQNINETETKIQKLNQKKINLEKRLEQAKTPHKLLFESGKMLEKAIAACLKLIGFNTHSYRNREPEFDVMCKSKEGICLGEVEAKDNKAVGTNKISLLIRNLNEYIKKGNKENQVKGVLFGNGYRFEEPTNRPNQFTDECIKTAKQHNIALVCTTDLFYISQYLGKYPTANFATKCREAILSAKGIVVFDPIFKSVTNELR